VDPTPPPNRSKTLGDLLYANKAKRRVAETEWIALVQAIAARDERALRALFDQTNRIVFTFIMRITRSRETAEELTLDVFHDVWRRASAYDPASGSVIGWIMNQARSRAIDRLRFDQRKKRTADAAETSSAVTPEKSPHDTVESRDQERQLREALQVLTPDERQAIEAAFFSEMTYSEVATKLNQPLGTVKTRIRSGLAKLREALAGMVISL
jgi:RNA polymerase sigma-70 factor, ECF subfamily